MRDLILHLVFLLRLSQERDLICVALLEIHFQTHLGFWRNSFPCVCRIKYLFPCCLLTGGYPQSLDVSFPDSWLLPLSASSGFSSPSPASYLLKLTSCFNFLALTWKSSLIMWLDCTHLDNLPILGSATLITSAEPLCHEMQHTHGFHKSGHGHLWGAIVQFLLPLWLSW